MAPNPRVAKAFHAMRELGIPEEKTKRVLKNLLKLYEKNWELIEEENYRALADAIFDSEETETSQLKNNDDNAEAEAAEQKKRLEQTELMKAIEEETQMPEEPERPLKRLRLRNRDGQASPSCINASSNSHVTPLKKPKLEIDDLPDAIPRSRSRVKNLVGECVSPPPQGRNKGKQPILADSSAQPHRSDVEKTQLDIANESEPDSAICPRDMRDKGKEPLSHQTRSREKRSVSDRIVSSHGVRFKEPKPKQNNLASVKPKDEPVTDDTPPLQEPHAMISPGTQLASSTENHRPHLLTSQIVAKEHLSSNVPISSNDTSATIPDETTANLDIASSSSGDIKISLSCNTVGKGKTKFSILSADSLLKTMEDKYLKSYKVLDPNFSLEKLMTYMCECILDIEFGVQNKEPRSLAATPNNDTTADVIRSLHDVNDISKGQESMIISLVNDVNNECPPSFHYIRQNSVYQNAYVNFSLARISDDNSCSTCFGNCLESSTGCACALSSGGEFVYTLDGLVKEEVLDEFVKMNRDPQKRCLSYCKECPLERSKNEEIIEPCKGHSVRNFFKECWLKCGCSKQCGNRVVQRGIKWNLQVFMTPGGKGWGLRTLEDLPKGAFVCEYVGEVLTNAELFDRVAKSSNKDEYAYPVLLDGDWGPECELKDEEALCLDATYYGNVARFINHRCFDSNLVDIPVEVENPDHHYYHLAFFTTRKVKALEELTWDYGIDFDDEEHPVKAFQCQCESKFCRNIKRPNRPRKRRCT